VTGVQTCALPIYPISHGFVIIGGEEDNCEAAASIFIKKMGPHTQMHIMKDIEAECVKYWENVWGAMKVTFANVMYDCLEAMGVNYYRTREGFVADPRVERMHTAVFKNERGFGGKCFPKDTSAVIEYAKKAGYDPKFLSEVQSSNHRIGELLADRNDQES
jgi:UDPglucose 6-dehydrogenase